MAWTLRYASDVTIVSAFIVISLSIVTTMRLAKNYHWRWRMHDEAGTSKSTWVQQQMRWLYAGERLNRWVGYVIGSCIVMYGAVVTINCVSVPMDIRMLAGVAALIVLTSIVVHRAGRETGWLERAALYTSALIAVYLDRTGVLDPAIQLFIEVCLFILLIAGIVIRMLLKTDRRFRVTPLDVLVLIAAIALPNLPGSLLSGYAIGTVIWKSLVLFYAIENLSVSSGVQWRLLASGTLMFLSAVALRSAI